MYTLSCHSVPGVFIRILDRWGLPEDWQCFWVWRYEYLETILLFIGA